MAVHISEKEGKALSLLQFAYRNIAVLTPEKFYAEADTLGVRRCVAEYMLEKSGLLKHDSIGDMHTYTWNLQQKADGKDVIPNIYMVRNVFDTLRSQKQRTQERLATEKEAIEKINHPVFDSKVHFKIEKFVTHVRQHAEDWVSAPDLNPSKVLNEIELGMDVLTVMCMMNVVLTKGNGRGRSYKWNPDLKFTDELVVEIQQQRKLYLHDRVSIKKYPNPYDGLAAAVESGQLSEMEIKEIRMEPAVPKAVQTESGSDLLPKPAVEPATEIKTEEPAASIKSKRRTGYKQFAWTREEEWAIKQGLAEGMDYKGIADLLGRSEGSVAGKIHWMRKAGMFDAELTLPVDEKKTEKPDAETVEGPGLEALGFTEDYRGNKIQPKRPGLFRRMLNAIFKR